MAADNDNATLRCGMCPQLGRQMCVRCEAADEIERLRAEIDRLREVLANWQTEAEMEHAERLRLQALIDAYAEAVRTGTADDWHSAYGALLAAATKADGRG